MDRNRKILISILAMLVLSSVVAILDITINIQQKNKGIGLSIPQTGPGIGIVRVDGVIRMSGQRGLLGMDAGGAEAVIQQLDNFEHDPNIRAVVLRINSPGGTVAATQEIYQKLWKLRKKNIPLIASMGDVAASGGYYIASACNIIIANYGTITGSIGVIAESTNFKKLFDKIGIKMNVIKSGKYKDVMSPHRDMTNAERQLIQEIIDSSYKKFLADVALGRNLNQSEIAPYADGRVFTGYKAMKLKLVDKIGTFEDAIAKAKAMGKLPEDAPVYTNQKTPLEEFLVSLKGMFQGNSILNSFKSKNSNLLEYRYVQ